MDSNGFSLESTVCIRAEAFALFDSAARGDLAEDAFLIVQTGETRVYGNALLRKGVVTSTSEERA